MKQILVIYFLLFITISCKDKNIPDVSDIDVHLNVVRTEVDLGQAKDTHDYYKISAQYEPFYHIYLDEILGYKGIFRDSQWVMVDSFFRDSVIMDLKKKIQSTFGDFANTKKEIEQMFRYLKHYFPERPIEIPNIYTFISEYEYQMFIFEDKNKMDGIGIGLDMFLYPQIHYKMIDPKNTNFSDYITRSWNRDHITKKMCDLFVTDIIGEAPGHRLLDQMIHNGKQMYINKLLLPMAHDSVITEYSLPQLRWCDENASQIWSFFMSKKLFYESNLSKINKYLNPSPNSPDMPSEAPGRTANYLGWKIISAYMERYPSTSVQKLLEMKDAQMILEKSKYKPTRS